MPMTLNLVQQVVPLDGRAAVMVSAMRGNVIVDAVHTLDVAAVKYLLLDAILGRRDASVMP